MKTKLTATEHGPSETIAFGQRDRLKREIGCIVSRSIATFAEIGEDARSWYRQAPGTYFAARVQAARNGIRYGASQGVEYFATEAQREAYIAKRIATSRKAAEKKGA